MDVICGRIKEQQIKSDHFRLATVIVYLRKELAVVLALNRPSPKLLDRPVVNGNDHNVLRCSESLQTHQVVIQDIT